MLQLKKFPDIPVSTRGSTRVLPTSRGAPIPPQSSRAGILSLRVRERIPGVPVTSEVEALSTERREKIQVPATIPRVPQMSQSIPGKPVFPALPRLSSRDRLTPRWHVEQPCGKASWESLEGKPRAKATDPLIHDKGSVTLLLLLERKAQVHAPTRDKD